MKAMEDKKTNGDEAEAYIMSLSQKYSSQTTQATISNVAAKPATTLTLKSILKRAKNSKPNV